MPKVFLSPSTQEWNEYLSGGTEEEYMNLIAARMEPYLRSSGIAFVRNDPDKNVAGAIADSNAGEYDVHLALHSNAGGEDFAGKLRGIDVYYNPENSYSQTLATIIANNLQAIYPLPKKSRALPATNLGEVLRTNAVAVLAELGYHDNPLDEAWIKGNLNAIAKNLVRSLCDYFGIPFVEAGPVRRGIVITEGGNLNLRRFPSMNGEIIGSLPDGANVVVYGKTGDWYVVSYKGQIGYANADFIVIG